MTAMSNKTTDLVLAVMVFTSVGTAIVWVWIGLGT
jgi:hypothetical protein